jgi:hypothetical protein
MRAKVQSRVEEIRVESASMYGETIHKWNVREQYNADIKKKNECLALLLQKATDAINEIKSREEGVDDKKNKGKKPPPKKK